MNAGEIKRATAGFFEDGTRFKPNSVQQCTVDVVGSSLFLSRSRLERRTIAGDSPVGEGERYDP